MAGRRSWGVKDMVLTMAVVLVVVGLIALYGNNVSFLPFGGAKAAPTEPVDVEAGFRHAAATFDFPIVAPTDLPTDWRGNAITVSDPGASREGLVQVGTLKAVRGGWLTPDGRYIQLVEVAADAPAALVNEFGTARRVTGTVDVDGVTWQVTEGVRGEVVWFRTADVPTGMTTFLITGSAESTDFQTLARALAISS